MTTLTAAPDAELTDTEPDTGGPTPPANAGGCETPETHNWGCGCAPAGPGAARQVATYLAAHAHSHLVASGQTECLSSACPGGSVDTVLAGVNAL